MNAEEVKQQIQELEEVRRQTRRMRLLTIIALVVIVFTGVSAIINSAYSLTVAGPKQDLFLKTLGSLLQRDMTPALKTMGSRSLARLKPAVEAEMQQANRRAPDVAEVALHQLDLMADELPTHASKIMDQTLESTMHRRDAKLRQLYPDIYDQQINTLLDNLALEAEDQLGQSGETVFNSHLNSVQHILANMDKIQQTDAPGAGQNLDAWQTTFMFMDLFVTEFRDLAPANSQMPATTVAPSAHLTKT